MRSNDLPEQADEGTRLLADPTRFQVFQLVVSAGDNGLNTAEVSAQTGIHRNVARMHLEKLAKAGLLKSTLSKQPGGGRPARVYRLGDTVTCQYPPRDYQLLAEVALTALEDASDPMQVARRVGRRLGRQSLDSAGIDPKKATLEKLLSNFKKAVQKQGTFARVESPEKGVLQVMVLNCIFRELSARHTNLVCGLHRQLFLGLCESHFGKVQVRQGNMKIARGGVSCRYTVKLAS